MTTAYARLPLNALRVFEAVASRLSFADAAEALHVTPAAVSQQIKSLEDYLQVQLFKRAGRRIELTAEGQQLLPGVRRGLDELEASMQHLKQHRAEGHCRSRCCRLFSSAGFCRELRGFNNLETGVELRFHTGRDPVDFSRSEMHVAIRMGLGKWPGLHVEKLLDEWVIPIASPALLAKYGPVPRGEDLQNFPLLGSFDEPWQAWIEKGQEGNWLARAPIIDDSAGVIAAAEEGVGFALARWSLVQRSLEQGRVVLAGDAMSAVPLLLLLRVSRAVSRDAEGQALPRLALRFREELPQAAHPVREQADCTGGRAQGRGARILTSRAVRHPSLDRVALKF